MWLVTLCIHLKKERTLGFFLLPSAFGEMEESRHSQEAKSCVASGMKKIKSKITRSVSLVSEFSSHGMTLVRNFGSVHNHGFAKLGHCSLQGPHQIFNENLQDKMVFCPSCSSIEIKRNIEIGGA